MPDIANQGACPEEEVEGGAKEVRDENLRLEESSLASQY